MSRPLRRMVATVLTMLALAASGAAASATQPVTRWVDDDGHAGPRSCDTDRPAASRVQDAIDASGPGDAIIVCPGRYRQDLTVSGAGKAGLRIRGVVPGTARLRASFDGDVPLLLVEDADDVTLQDLVFQAPTATPCRRVAAMVRIQGSRRVEVTGSRLEPVGTDTIGPCGFDDGIDILAGAGVHVRDVRVRDFQSVGIFATGVGTKAVVEDSVVRYLHAAEDADQSTLETSGIFFDGDVAATVRRNVVRSGEGGGIDTPLLYEAIDLNAVPAPFVIGNRTAYAIYGVIVGSTAFGLMSGNIALHGRDSGLTTSVGIWPGGDGVQVVDNIARGQHTGYYTDSAANSEVHDNDFRGNRVFDCHDLTTGAGTAGTANTYQDNRGPKDDPSGICGS